MESHTTKKPNVTPVLRYLLTETTPYSPTPGDIRFANPFALQYPRQSQAACGAELTDIRHLEM